MIDPSICWGVRRAVRAFLGGKNFKLEKINQATRPDSDRPRQDNRTRTTPADCADAAESPYALLETHVRSLGNSIGRDLAWLHGLLKMTTS